MSPVRGLASRFERAGGIRLFHLEGGGVLVEQAVVDTPSMGIHKEDGGNPGVLGVAQSGREEYTDSLVPEIIARGVLIGYGRLRAAFRGLLAGVTSVSSSSGAARLLGSEGVGSTGGSSSSLASSYPYTDCNNSM